MDETKIEFYWLSLLKRNLIKRIGDGLLDKEYSFLGYLINCKDKENLHIFDLEY